MLVDWRPGVRSEGGQDDCLGCCLGRRCIVGAGDLHFDVVLSSERCGDLGRVSFQRVKLSISIT